MVGLVRASAIVEQALGYGKQLKLPPLTVAVLDSRGCLVVFKREDDTSLLREQIAQAKAWGALAMGSGGRGLAQKHAIAPGFFASITELAGGRMVPVPGGVLIRDADGKLLGAVGVSGAAPDGDEACAVSGIESAGLVAVTD